MLAHPPTGSHFGQNMLEFVTDIQSRAICAYEAAVYLLTNGGMFAKDSVTASLGFFDQAAFEALERERGLAVSMEPTVGEPCLSLYLNSLGRFYIRRADEAKP